NPAASDFRHLRDASAQAADGHQARAANRAHPVCDRLALVVDLVNVKGCMEVILREHVDNLGRRGEIVKVADGYARNYLLPRKLALPATAGNKKQVERERANFDAREAEESKVAQAMADQMANLEVVIARKVGETEALYGSVTSADISEALAAKGLAVDRRKVQLREPIKKLGEYDIPVKLHRAVVAGIKVRVGAEGS